MAQGNWRHTYLPAPYRCTHGRWNPLHAWFRELGIEDLRSHEKRLPAAIYAADDAEVCLFLRHLWATDGCVWLGHGKSADKAYYASSSRELASGVAHLLGRLGIVRDPAGREGRLPARLPRHRGRQPDLRTFCERVGVHGRRGEMVRELAVALAGRTVNANVDTIPVEVWDVVKAERIRAGLTERQFQAAIGTHYCGTALYEGSPSRERLLRCANGPRFREAARDRQQRHLLGPDREHRVPGTAACLRRHGEGHAQLCCRRPRSPQLYRTGSDVVILLHREDAYERESPRHGEADLIVAKHRNGPTATVTVAFRGHYSTLRGHGLRVGGASWRSVSSSWERVADIPCVGKAGVRQVPCVPMSSPATHEVMGGHGRVGVSERAG